jgi:hypothetical protein
MIASEFVEAYPSTMRPRDIHSGPHSEFIKDAQQWSYEFGLVLHHYLSGGEPEATPEFDGAGYDEWVENFIETEGDVIAQGFDDPNALRALNELNFHGLNRSMRRLWLPLLNPDIIEDKKYDTFRRDELSTAQETLALNGLVYAHARLGYATSKPENMDDPGLRQLWNRLSGLMLEYDAAIISITALRKHPGVIVLPAPLQFERGRNKATNVDLVVIDTLQHHAVGEQIKSKYNPLNEEESDQDRVVFVNGDTDLGSARVMAEHKGEKPRTMSWPGLVAADQVLKMRSYGPRAIRSVTSGNLLMRQGWAKENLKGALKVNYNEAASQIGKRIMAKL